MVTSGPRNPGLVLQLKASEPTGVRTPALNCRQLSLVKSREARKMPSVENHSVLDLVVGLVREERLHVVDGNANGKKRIIR